MVIYLNITGFGLETMCFIKSVVTCCIFINSMQKIISDIVSNCFNQSGNKAELNNIRQSIRVVVFVLSPEFKRHVAGG